MLVVSLASCTTSTSTPTGTGSPDGSIQVQDAGSADATTPTAEAGSTPDASLGQPDAGSDAAGDSGGTADASSGDASVAGGDAGDGGNASDAGDAGEAGTCNHAAQIQGAFQACSSTGVIGQNAYAPGVTCAEVCCVFGYASCQYRASQSGLSACAGGVSKSGECADVFQALWSSQCVCQ